MTAARTLQEFCLRLLVRGDLASKLAPPRGPQGRPLVDQPAAPVLIDQPAREASLEMSGGAERLPRPRDLIHPSARAECLARFAHHELMAVELFAWALLRWPDAPAPLRKGLLSTLADEQRHCGLYLSRLKAHGEAFEGRAHSDYFWRQAPAIAESPAGLGAFLAAMGLTLEQANLDFSLTYRDGFREAGDERSAQVCQTVHDDEIRHVALAAQWLPLITAPSPGAGAPSQIEAYQASVPFPLAANRAKGRRFDVPAREAAGLDRPFIEFVRQARSSQQLAGRPRSSK